MGETPLVSVLIPAYNHAPYIRQAVDSVLRQTYQNFELIVVDDGSSDDTWPIIESIKDSRIRLIRHDVNQGAHAALNEALRVATGEFISILNSDDLYAENRLEKILEAIRETNQKQVFVFTDVEFIDAGGNTEKSNPRVGAYAELMCACEKLSPDYWFFNGNLAVTTSNFFFSRSVANAVGEFARERYVHDWDWAFRVCRLTTPIWLRGELLKYRVHSANTLSESLLSLHIVENSVVQSRALQAILSGPHSEKLMPGICTALINNESFHPLPTLLHLLLDISCQPPGKSFKREGGLATQLVSEIILNAPGPLSSAFRSIHFYFEQSQASDSQAKMLDERYAVIQHMSNEIASRDEVISSQAAIIDERWRSMLHMSNEIDARDHRIADLTLRITEVERAHSKLLASFLEPDHPVFIVHHSRFIRLILRLRQTWVRLLCALKG